MPRQCPVRICSGHDHISYDGQAVVRALNSISPAQVEAVNAAVRGAGLGGAWHVLSSDDYDGYLHILIEPTAPDSQPSFYVSGRTQCLGLFEVHRERMTPVACFCAVDSLISHLLNSLVGR